VFRTLILMLAGWFGLLPHQQRRLYKVVYFGETIGTFNLPRADHLADRNAPVREILTKPFKVEAADIFFYFYWVERDAEGAYKTITWNPDVADERAEATRFFNAAHGLNPDGTPNPAAEKPLPVRSPEEERLIAAVLADRDNEQVYRDYATYLVNQRASYGRYIHLSLDLAKLKEGTKEWEAVAGRRQELVRQYGAGWVRPITELGLYPGINLSFMEGFVADFWFNDCGVIEELSLDERGILPRHAARVFHAAPFLRKLSIRDSDLTLADVVALPQLAQIESLVLWIKCEGESDGLVLAQSRHLGRLRELDMSSCYINSQGAIYVSQADWLGGLRKLDCHYCNFGDEGVEALARSPGVGNLVEWITGGNNLTDAALRNLAASKHLAKLESLGLASSRFTAAGIESLASAAFLGTLKSLDLSACELDPDAVRALAAIPFSTLKLLNLGYNMIDDEAATALVAAPYFHRLEVLTLSDNRAADSFVAAVVAAGFLSLKELDLSSNQITGEGFAGLAGSKAFTKVAKLTLSANPLEANAIKTLARANWPSLEDLHLDRVALGTDAVRALCSAPLPKLQHLWVTEEQVEKSAQPMLKKRFGDRLVGISS
jgi:hypothetical protein